MTGFKNRKEEKETVKKTSVVKEKKGEKTPITVSKKMG